MPVYLIRHACAGDKHQWSGRDADRPLDPSGIGQAEVLAKHLARDPIHRLLTSPTHRCVQTMGPLAHTLGLPVEPLDEVDPDGDPDYLHRLLPALDAGTGAICTHGEVMRPLLATLRHAGTKIVARRDDDEWLLSKGTAWSLTVSSNGSIVTLQHRAPHALPACADHERAGV